MRRETLQADVSVVAYRPFAGVFFAGAAAFLTVAVFFGEDFAAPALAAVAFGAAAFFAGAFAIFLIGAFAAVARVVAALATGDLAEAGFFITFLAAVAVGLAAALVDAARAAGLAGEVFFAAAGFTGFRTAAAALGVFRRKTISSLLRY